MSTRGAIARPNGEGFSGVYHHWDGYPSGLGATLFDLRNGFFGGDTDAMLKFLIDDHPAGWSTIEGKDLARKPGFHEDFMNLSLKCRVCKKNGDAHLCQTTGYKKHLKAGKEYPCGGGVYSNHLGHQFDPDPAEVADRALDPQCYCHGDRKEEGWVVTAENAQASGVEYAYVLDGSRMLVLSSYSQDGSKMIGAFGTGDADATWSIIADVDLDAPAPDWEKVNEAA